MPTQDTPPLFTRRAELLARLAEPRHYDLAIVGGGATGLGVALDAAARGFSVVLVESHDFAKGTSSRSTKLVHGGVRYLAQGNIALVREALRERTLLLNNAPHLAQPLAFVMPSYQWWKTPCYGLGLKLYDLLAGQAGLGRTEWLTRAETLALVPTVQAAGLKGGVKYWDGQFDDARLALALARTAASHGALLLNYCRAVDFLYDAGRVAGLRCEDTQTGSTYRVHAGCVINAAGVWADGLQQQDSRRNGEQDSFSSPPMMVPSQGAHVVVDREFLGSDVGLLVPDTADGRVLFAVPWLGKVILGTTDTPCHDLSRDPSPFNREVDFILQEAGRYLRRAPGRADIKSCWAGLRPLVKPAGAADQTPQLSREHKVLVSPNGLVSVIGGKWTTYRAMAEDVLDQCMERSLLGYRAKGVTETLRLMGAPAQDQGAQGFAISQPAGIHMYGSEQAQVMQLPGAHRMLCEGLTEAMVRFAARYEYAMTVEDVLARRSRLLFLDAGLASSLAAEVGLILGQETGLDPQVSAFVTLAQNYLHTPA